MNLTHDVLYQDFDDVSVRLVYESMLDRNISSCDVEGLTLDEVKNKILPGNRLHRIIVNDGPNKGDVLVVPVKDLK